MLSIVAAMRMRREGLVAIWNNNCTQLWCGNLKCTGCSKSLCEPDDYNTESYK